MCPLVDASYLMSSSPPQFRCLNCSTSQVCSQDGTWYQVRGTHNGTYDHHSALCLPLPSQTQVLRLVALLLVFFFFVTL